jgi:hypothetical protein
VLHRPVELAALIGKVKSYFKWTVTRVISRGRRNTKEEPAWH